MGETQEQILKVLEELVRRAKENKNVIEYDELLKAFEGYGLPDDKMDEILEYFEKKGIDKINGRFKLKLTPNLDR